MPIAIRCSQCEQTYNVDDKLAGKKVKCRNCGAVITVSATEGGAGIEEEGGVAGAAVKARGKGMKAVQICPSCGGNCPEGAKICLACGAKLSGGGGALGAFGRAEMEADGEAITKKKHYQPRSGSPFLESLDELIKLIAGVLILGGAGIWVWHLYAGPGLTGVSIWPLAIWVLMMPLLMGILGVLGINTVVRQLRYVPRDDTFMRMCVVVFVPLAMSLLAGWPGAEDSLTFLPTLGWVLGVALFIYMFRAEAVEWVASVLMGGAALAIGALVMSLLAGPLNSAAGPFYTEMVPGGPWSVLAVAGKMPVVKPPIPKPAATETVVVNATTETAPATTSVAATEVATQSATQVATASAPATTTVAGGGGGGGAANTKPAVPPGMVVEKEPLISAMLAAMHADEIGLRKIDDVVVGTAPSPYALVVKNSDTTATVERWALSPLEKHGEASFTLFPKEPNMYALAPKGEAMAALVVFPRTQVEVVAFDAKTGVAGAKKIISLSEADATPTLMGFLDAGHVMVRWDKDAGGGKQSAFQIFATATGTETKVIRPDLLDLDANGWTLSPDGRLVAALTAKTRDPEGKEQPQTMLIYNTVTGNLAKRFMPTTLPFEMIRMAFSWDSNQLAMFALVQGVPTVIGFKALTGDATYTAILPNAAVPRRAAGGGFEMSHGMIWLPQVGGAATTTAATGGATAAAPGVLWLVGGNDFVDAVAGRKVGSLTGAGGLERAGVVDEMLASPDFLLFEIRHADGRKSLTVARVDVGQLKP